ncbi:hypothetical protein BK022_18190 [Methylorubrum extorquens]|uniref:Uncharacterized protein n=1 Tax=Methylorubrum extorquens TaxID=408 RepID=A0A1S1P3D1_METEX|nr:hypothetical protein BK022_18190 [Methylorubrum extorquens]
MIRGRPAQWQTVTVFTIQPSSACQSLRRTRLQLGDSAAVQAVCGPSGCGAGCATAGRGGGRLAGGEGLAGQHQAEAKQSERRAEEGGAQGKGSVDRAERLRLI